MVALKFTIALVGIVLALAFADETESDLNSKFLMLDSQLKKLSQKLSQDNLKVTDQLKEEASKVIALKEQVDILKGQLEKITLENKYQMSSKHGLGILKPNRRYSRSTAGDPDVVVFSAELSHVLDNVALHSTVVFDHPIFRVTHSYDASTGVFTCPTSGLYLFSVFIATHKTDTEALVYLVLDGNPYMSVISDRSSDGENDSGGNVVMLPVNKGQRVWVETDINDKQSFWPSFTTFSGVLIHQTQ
ncbi:complement C1q tumor necrosis factor-related protein 5-like [Ruditapes philippinarum]|uniref:complement C1q tumor necrosis factor-related protein 5-like n=1 Tax=Ruditapes philippinarum TaxID=129788 RepID=UPI00295B5891|nr:complement C1q tumor necrosis factor-related protein 5-like [Ruditapes philippinarum]